MIVNIAEFVNSVNENRLYTFGISILRIYSAVMPLS